MALYAGNARRALSASEAREVADWLDKLEHRAAEAVADIRRVVHGLRPPVLDELGLVGAIRSASTGLPVSVHVECDEPLPDVSAAAEVAAYRITVEALTNTVRHAGATSATVRIHADQELILEVADDGRGLAVDHPIGVGLRSMRERAEELGGTLTVSNPSEGGLRVCAQLPVGEPAVVR